MAFDACFLSCVVKECRRKLTNGKVEKIYQPSKNEILIPIRTTEETCKLYINAGSQSPRVHLTSMKCDNPSQPPVFCMFLRKHLQGARVVSVEQMSFERVICVTFTALDEMGYPTEKRLICEIMGKYSNLMLCDKEGKILTVLHPVDFSMSQKRQVLPGMRYELPPAQDKLSLLETAPKDFSERWKALPTDTCMYKAISNGIGGVATSTAKQIVFLWKKDENAMLNGEAEGLAEQMRAFREFLLSDQTTPCLMKTNDGKIVDYSFFPLSFTGIESEICESFGEALDRFYIQQEQIQRNRSNGEDIVQVLKNAEGRLEKKRTKQLEELSESARGEEYKLYGDLLTSNIYRIRRGMPEVVLENYYENYTPVTIPLDIQMSPQGNAQKYYKKYAKAKSAALHLREQLEKSEAELSYLSSVRDEFSRAESEQELDEIRSELRQSGYMHASKKELGSRRKATPTVLFFRSSDGRKIWCGKNNLANDYLTFHMADKNDWWFHAKNQHGSHVVMSSEGEEPTDRDFTQAAEIAAYYSGYEGNQIPVDYTKVRNVKKPPNAAPGYVLYHTNWTAYVSPQAETISALKSK